MAPVASSSFPRLCLLAAAATQLAAGANFLERNEAQIAAQVEALFGRGPAEGRIQRLESQMKTMFDALPKDAVGRLGYQGVQYALHRFFVQHHGWNIEGLHPQGKSSNATSPVSFLEGRVPALVKAGLEKKLSRNGFTLRDIATLASVVELLARTELIDRLTDSYESAGLEVTSAVSEQDVGKVLNWHYIIYILASESITLSEIREYSSLIDQIYPGWDDTIMFVEDMRRSLAWNERHRTNPFVRKAIGMEEVVQTAEAINDKFGRFQHFECQGLKDLLLEREDRGTGRILLSDFYGLALSGEWRFSEKVEYLRELGALDESDPRKPSVIVTNYIYSPSNCLAASDFYSVCCSNDCEGLLSHLEEVFKAPEASPASIMEAVAALPSATVAAPRNLSQGLVDRLQQIADFHGGSVPLHGRLFAQWMHHAYPRECPYPHTTGSVNPEKPNVWAQRQADAEGIEMDEFQSLMTAEEMIMYVPQYDAERGMPSQSRDHEHDLDEERHHSHLYGWVEPSPWTGDEELFAVPEVAAGGTAWELTVPSAFRLVAMLAAATAMLILLASSVPDKAAKTGKVSV